MSHVIPYFNEMFSLFQFHAECDLGEELIKATGMLYSAINNHAPITAICLKIHKNLTNLY
jgi:hypothetical protein